MDVQQFLGSPIIATLAFIAGGVGGLLIAKIRSSTDHVDAQDAVVMREHVLPPKVDIVSLEGRHKLMRWRDQFHLDLEKVITQQLEKIDGALSEKSTWWGVFKMKSAAEAMDEALTAALLEVWWAVERLMGQLNDQERGGQAKVVHKFDPAPLLLTLGGIRFLPLNREKIQAAVHAAFLGANGVQNYYSLQSSQLIKKAGEQQ